MLFFLAPMLPRLVETTEIALLSWQMKVFAAEAGVPPDASLVGLPQGFEDMLDLLRSQKHSFAFFEPDSRDPQLYLKDIYALVDIYFEEALAAG